MRLQKQLEPRRVKYLNNCSHALFVDQQAAFITALGA